MDRRRLPAAALAALVGIGVAGAPANARAQFGSPVRGQSLFVQKGCVECHAVRGTGGRIGPDLGRTATKGSFFELTAGMWNHSTVMGQKMKEARIPRPSFEGNELGDLIAFLYFLNYFDEPGDPEVGKVLFAQKHCIQCHRLGAEGGTAGPPLDRLPRGTSPLRIAQDLWNHGPVMVPAIRRAGLDVPKFQGNEIVDLFAYLRSQGERSGTREFRSAGDPDRGRSLFVQKGCARCHSLFGRGSTLAPDLGKAELRGSVTQLAGRMWNHWAAMADLMKAIGMAPPTFQGDEMADLFAYLFLTRYQGPPGDATRGEAVYRKAGCASCHGPKGEGNIGPALRPLTGGETKEAIAQRMWNHAPQMGQRMSTYAMPWPQLQADELTDLFALLEAGFEPARADRPAGRAPGTGPGPRPLAGTRDSGGSPASR
jgi:mono/diheme cytochrome c family protein